MGVSGDLPGRTAGYREIPWAEARSSLGTDTQTCGVEVAKVLTTLGDIRLAAGDRIEAEALFVAALAILDELRLPQADDLRDRLAGTTRRSGAPARTR